MKELVYRDILGHNPRKREVSIEEINDLTKNSVSKKWVCKYFVKERFSSDNNNELRSWIHRHKVKGDKKNCHILRQLDTRTGENKIVCKILGEFYVIYGKTAYSIVYINEVRISIDVNKQKERK